MRIGKWLKIEMKKKPHQIHWLDKFNFDWMLNGLNCHLINAFMYVYEREIDWKCDGEIV